MMDGALMMEPSSFFYIRIIYFWPGQVFVKIVEILSELFISFGCV